MNAKRKGWRQEDKARKILIKAGYDVFRSGGSFGIWDLIACNQNGWRMIQVKTSYCCPADRELLELYKAPPNTTKELWIFKDRVKEPIITILK